MSLRDRIRGIWRSLWTDLPEADKQWIATYLIASRITGGDPAATALLAAQIQLADKHDPEGAPMALHDYRRLIDQLATTDGVPAFLAVDLVDEDTIRLSATASNDQGIDLVLTAAQLDELGDAIDGALDALTPPEPDQLSEQTWDERAAGYVSRLAAQMDDAALADEVYQRLRDEIHDLAPADKDEMLDALLVRAAATLCTFRDHVRAGEQLVAIANRAAS